MRTKACQVVKMTSCKLDEKHWLKKQLFLLKNEMQTEKKTLQYMRLLKNLKKHIDNFFFQIEWLKWLNNTLDNITIECKKLATIVLGRKNIARPFLRRKQLSTSAEHIFDRILIF